MNEFYLKYHHLGLFHPLSVDLEHWKTMQRAKPIFHNPEFPKLTIANLYRVAENAYSFISSSSYETGKRILNDTKEIPEDTVNHDYAGATGGYVDEFVRRISIQCQQLLLSNPNIKVRIGYHADGFCESCIIKAPGTDVGPHCVEQYAGVHDYIWEKTLDVIGHPAIKKSDLEPEHTTQIGILRDLSISGVLREAHAATALEIANSESRLLQEGILIRNFLGDLVVNRSRLRGKEY